MPNFDVRKDSSMSEPRRIAVKPITATEFAPYGWLLTSQPGAPDGGAFAVLRIEESDFTGGRALMQMLTVRWRELSFTHMEQHASFTQAFLPADGKPGVTVVALPVGAPGSEPDLSSIRAFLLDGAQGILLAKGTWHCPPFPLVEKATFAMTTCVDTPKETEGYLDVSAIAGHSFEVTL